jgi:hypothetical protein
MRESKNPILILSVIITFLSAIASAGGLVFKEGYRDNDFIKISWMANDMVTLFVIVPLLIAVLIFSDRGNSKSKLVLLGLLAYMAYNYAFYLFGAVFNVFFLLYVAIFALSIFALIAGFYNIDLDQIGREVKFTKAMRWIPVYLLFTTIPLLIVEGSQCVLFILTEKEPIIPPLIFALDLSIVVPNSILAAILFWQRKPLGFVLSLIMLVKGFTYGLVLCTGTTMLAFSEVYGKWDPLMPFYITVAIGGLVGSIYLLLNYKPAIHDV